MALLLGGTGLATIWTLSLFTAGFGAGALLLTGAARPVRRLAQAQVAAAFLGLGIPHLEPAFGGVAGLCAVVAGAFALGAALPLLIRLAGPLTARGAGVLQASGFAGAAVGGLASGLVLIGSWGLAATGAAAAAVNLLVAGAVGLVFRGHASRTADDPRAARSIPAVRGMSACAAAGASAVGLQVVVIRMWTMKSGSHTGSLAILVVAVLASMGFGSLLFSGGMARSDRWRAALLGILTLDAVLLPRSVERLAGGAWPWGELAGALVAVGLLAAVLGAVAPAGYAMMPGSSARRAALAFGSAAFGSALGGLACGLLVVPAAGPTTGLVFCGVLAVLAVCFLAGRSLVLCGVLCCGALLWVHGSREEWGTARSPSLANRPDLVLVAEQRDAVTTAAVVDDNRRSDRALYTQGFSAASTGPDGAYMTILGSLPAALSADPSSACLIAYGTGTTAAALLAAPGVQRLDIVEISRAVLGLSPWFAEANAGLEPLAGLPDGSVLHIEDGRRFLERRSGPFGVITLEPFPPYAPGATHLYSREFYAAARRRLAPGGVLAAWIPFHSVSPAEARACVSAFLAVFPEGCLWRWGTSAILTGSPDGLPPGRLARAVEAIPTAAAHYVARGAALKSWINGAEPLTDDRPWPETAPPRSGRDALAWTVANLRSLEKCWEGDPTGVGSSGMRRAGRLLLSGLAARHSAVADRRIPEPVAEGTSPWLLDASLGLAPQLAEALDYRARWAVDDAVLGARLAVRLSAMEQQRHLGLLHRAALLGGDLRWDLHLVQAALLAATGDEETAAHHLGRARELCPRIEETRHWDEVAQWVGPLPTPGG